MKQFNRNIFMVAMPLLPIMCISIVIIKGILFSDISVDKQVGYLVFFLFLVSVLVFYFYRMMKPRVIISGSHLVINNFFGKTETNLAEHDPKFGSDYIELFKDDVHQLHISPYMLSNKTWTDLVQEIKQTCSK